MVHALKYLAILVFMCLPNLTIFHSISLHLGPAEQFQNWLGMRIKFCKCMSKLLISRQKFCQKFCKKFIKKFKNSSKKFKNSSKKNSSKQFVKKISSNGIRQKNSSKKFVSLKSYHIFPKLFSNKYLMLYVI